MTMATSSALREANIWKGRVRVRRRVNHDCISEGLFCDWSKSKSRRKCAPRADCKRPLIRWTLDGQSGALRGSGVGAGQRVAIMIRFVAFLLAILAAVSAQADGRFITLSSTTSTQDSGLFGHILPIFTAATGITVHVVAVGTGQALAIGARGDADALLVHDRVGEDKFVADRFGIDRRDVMYNDFVIVGPGNDPAHIGGLKDARAALKQIATAAAPFASRGDDSGTNGMELRLWKSTGVQPDPHGGWYRDLGQGMGATL